MIVTVRAEKVNEKNELICLAFMIPPKLWSLSFPKRCIICNFVLTSVRKVSLFKQFTYMPLNVSITLFSENDTVCKGLSYRS